jgi:hypothetical protein
MTRFHRAVTSLLAGLLPVCLAATGAQASRSPQAPTSFNAPEPDHLSLFKLYMAAHGEALAGNANAMWEHYLLFRVPVGPAPKGLNDRGSPSKECLEFRGRLRNEITRQSIIEEARAQFRKALASTGGWPKTMAFRLELEQTLGEYDLTAASFPLAIVPSIRIAARPDAPTMQHAYKGPVQSWCPGDPAMISPDMRMGFASGLWFNGFSLKLVGTDALSRLPMSSAAAETFIESFSDGARTGGRRVRVEALVEVGPMPFTPNEAAPAKIVAARAFHPLTGAPLHTFDIGSSGAALSTRATAPPANPPAVEKPVARTAPSASAEGAAAPRPKSAASAQQSAPSFNAPEIDHLAMFNLYVAAHADVLASNVAAAWEHYLLFSVPKGSPFKHANDVGTPSKECMDLSGRFLNEVTRQSLVEKAQTQFRTALKSAAAGPKTGVFLLRTQERLGNYDPGSGTFPLEPGFNGPSVVRPEATLGLQIGREQACSQGYASTRQNWCNASWGSMEQFSSCARPFSLQILGGSALQRMPMEKGAAEAFLNADSSGLRSITLETVVEVGPVPLRAPDVAAFVAGKERTPARIVAARALDPKSGAVLQTFVIAAAKTAASTAPSSERPAAAPPAATAPPTAAPRPSSKPQASVSSSSTSTPTERAFPFTAYRGLLLTVRDQPSILTDQALIDLAQGQVRAEQNAWKVVSNRVAAGQSGLTLLNPKRPAFTYEWQTLVDTNPTLAGGPVLDTFVRTDADWSFVTSDPTWDDRFASATPVEVFLFARDTIEGRDHRFAAQELGLVYGRQLKMAAEKAHTRLSLRLRLPPGAYDFQARALRFLPRGASVVSGHRPVQELDLLEGAERYPEHYRLPPETRGRATYMLMGLSSELRRAEPPSTKPGIAMQDAPTDVWRGSVAIGASSNAVPLVELLALDRRARITTVPIDPARAEALARRQPGLPAIDGFTATIVFEAERVVLGERFVARKPTPNAVLLARVKKIDVFDPDGKLITSMPADMLPAAATTPSTRTAPAPPAAAPPAMTREEAAREKQRIENEKMDKDSAEIRRKAQAAANAAILAAGRTPGSATAEQPAASGEPRLPAQSTAGSGIAGCWSFNTVNLTIYDDGRITGFLDGGKWSVIGQNRFRITWPPSTETLELSSDGGTLTGSNNYGPAISAQRLSGNTNTVVGSWKWPDGLPTVLTVGGDAQHGSLSGKWTQVRDNTVRIVWNYFFTDDVTLSSDGQNLDGKNMVGTPVHGRRIPCSK